MRRHFYKGRGIALTNFSQFLSDYQKEMGRQAFFHAMDRYGTADGQLPAKAFVEVLKLSCGWRLPQGVIHRLEEVYCNNNKTDSHSS